MAAVIFFAFIPRGPLAVPPSGREASPSARGAYHIHTTASDGALPRDEVARAAARAGLRFAIFTDHGDGTATPAVPEYIHGVLCVTAVEVSTNQGHYVALGMSRAPYPLAGDASAVVEDVARLGGLGIAAHPFSARRELQWSDWSLAVDGLEWLNADSEWRDENWWTFGRTLAGYLWRQGPALAQMFDRPVEALRRWDEMAAGRRVLGLAAHDAHGGFGDEGEQRGRRVHVPSYEASFRSFSVVVSLREPLSGDAARDAERLLEAIRRHAVTTVIDSVAAPAALAFSARNAEGAFAMGDVIDAAPATLLVQASVPAGSTTVLLRNGQVVKESGGGVLEHSATDPGAYRVEVRVAGAPGSPPVPWVVTNPIYVGIPVRAPPASEDPASAEMPGLVWRVEHDDRTEAAVLTANGDAQAALEYRLAPAGSVSPFAALAADFPDRFGDFVALAIPLRADRPMRVSAQLRFGRHGGTRWRTSFYVDRTGREVVLRTRDLRPADGAAPRPPAADATSLLLVVDTTNARAGDTGTLYVGSPRVIR